MAFPGRCRPRATLALALLVGTGLAASALVGVGPGSAPAARAAGYCPAFSGPKWVATGRYALPGPASQKSGSQYTLVANGFACGKALKYARSFLALRLVKRVPNKAEPLKGGPAGFSCTGQPDSQGRPFKGICIAGGTYFAWNPKLATGVIGVS